MKLFKHPFFRRKSQNSSNTAKERLRLVLVQDKIKIDGNRLEGLKNDLIDVIDRHLDIDREAMEVSFQREGGSVAIVASIPMLKE